MAQTTLQEIGFDDALAQVERGAALIDLRILDAYLEVHVPASIGLSYEFGPGMAGRARDCIPLSVPLILMESDNANMLHAAASLRGKGFDVVGEVRDGLNLWANGHGKLASTDLKEGPVPPTHPVLDVGDFGRRAFADAVEIPVEVLWPRVDEFRSEALVSILCGRGLRAALAVGMLERVGVDSRLWRNVDQPSR